MIYLLSGDVRTGKTTAISDWSAGREYVGGFLSPDKNHKRVLKNIVSGETIPFEVETPTDMEITQIGRFHFYTSAFEEAANWVWEHIESGPIKVIVVDEIGKLELKNKGFHFFFEKLIKRRKDLTLIVLIRSSLLSEVINKYNLQDATIINIASLHRIDSI